jgi:hypothetical protein
MTPEKSTIPAVSKQTRQRMALSFYLLTVVFVMFVCVMHIFGVITFVVDKFTYFILSVAILILLMPVVVSMKFFGVLEARKDPSILSKK